MKRTYRHLVYWISLAVPLAVASCAGPTVHGSQVESAPDRAAALSPLDKADRPLAETVDAVLAALAVRDYPRLGRLLKLDEGRLRSAQGHPAIAGQLAARYWLGEQADRVQLLAWIVEEADIERLPDPQRARVHIDVTINYRQKLNRTPRVVTFTFELAQAGDRWLVVL